MKIVETIKYFKLHQTNGPILIMLRHAEKASLSKGLKDSDRSITKLGNKHAVYLGKILQDFGINLEVIKTSPLLRCVETGRAILKGMRKERRLQYSNYLGNPGAYVKDSHLAEETFNRYSVEEVVEKLLKNCSLPGFYSRQSGLSFLLRELSDDLEKLSHFGLYITHDTILAPFVGTVVDRIITQENWFGFLDGVCIRKLDDDIFELYWDTKRYTIHIEKKDI